MLRTHRKRWWGWVKKKKKRRYGEYRKKIYRYIYIYIDIYSREGRKAVLHYPSKNTKKRGRERRKKKGRTLIDLGI